MGGFHSMLHVYHQTHSMLHFLATRWLVWTLPHTNRDVASLEPRRMLSTGRLVPPSPLNTCPLIAPAGAHLDRR
eukprot:COSAG02_NODE_4890_length_4859_cov_15.448529_1_plen_73_part_10